MKRCILLALLLLMTGCAKTFDPQICIPQEAVHLSPDVILPSPMETLEKQPGVPLLYEEMRAVWIPVMQYESWLADGTEKRFRTEVRSAFARCHALGLNTVFLHVRAYGDVYYNSALFPPAALCPAAFDPLAVMLEEAHAAGLSAHAWLNPMRLMSGDALAQIPDRFPLRQWYDDPEKNGTWLSASDGLYYLNPAYPAVRDLIARSVTEILTQYDVDGIHIDDYFYPTQAEAFDAAAFAESGAADLAAWRRDNCSAMVQAIYDAVKDEDEALLFGISPQGNLHTCRDILYADAALWSSTEGYCDYIAPQLYYGFDNSTCPFAETAALWAETATAADLILGLAPYKIGMHDKWAGAGSEEWRTDADVLSRQIAFAKTLSNADGVALYSYAALFEPAEEAAAIVNDARDEISRIWAKY